MPQFTKQSTRPLTPAGYRARAKRMRALCDTIERYADAIEPQLIAQRTRAIHGLSLAAQDLSRKNRGF